MTCAECYTQPCYNKVSTRPLACLSSLLNVLCRGSPHWTVVTSASGLFASPDEPLDGLSHSPQSAKAVPVRAFLCSPSLGGGSTVCGHPVGERVVWVADDAPDLHKLGAVPGEPPFSERASGYA